MGDAERLRRHQEQTFDSRAPGAHSHQTMGAISGYAEDDPYRAQPVASPPEIKIEPEEKEFPDLPDDDVVVGKKNLNDAAETMGAISGYAEDDPYRAQPVASPPELVNVEPVEQEYMYPDEFPDDDDVVEKKILDGAAMKQIRNKIKKMQRGKYGWDQKKLQKKIHDLMRKLT